MHLMPLPLKDAYLIDLEKKTDERGFFARLFCHSAFAKAGLEPQFVQVNDSYSKEKGTLRGMHYQLFPAAEVKIIRCIRGAAFDVIVDIRPTSPTYKQWFSVTLTADSRQMIYAPRGFAHGFLTLEPDTELLYLVSHPYDKDLERGFRWDDPAFNIRWPFAPQRLSVRDRSHPDFISNNKQE